MKMNQHGTNKEMTFSPQINSDSEQKRMQRIQSAQGPVRSENKRNSVIEAYDIFKKRKER